MTAQPELVPVDAKGGTLVVHHLQSEALRDNPLGDPSLREVRVYLPPGFDPASPVETPALLALTGFTGTGASLFNIDPLGEDLKHRLDRLITTGACPPVIVVAPDCFTKLGGNQYVSSTATGRYEEFLIDEVIPAVTRRYRAGPWGVFGKSSGGYGAIMLGMRHPDTFRALADHSGDACFELCYMADMGRALDAFREAGGPEKWLQKFWADENHHRKKYHGPLNALAMAAHYSPDPSAPLGIAFPFDLETGVFRPEVWERWRAHDPVNLADKHAAALKKLALVYIDCGARDEFALQWGARALASKLRAAGVNVVHEEFEDGHMSVSYRYDRSLPMLVKALVEASSR